MKKLVLMSVYCSIILLILAFAVCAEDVRNINMKTSEYYTAYYELKNVNGYPIKDCVPYMTNDFDGNNWTHLSPVGFELPPGAVENIMVRFDYPPVGYYSGLLNVRCSRYNEDGKFVGVYDVVNPVEQPLYNVLVALAGEGQAYAFVPNNEFYFFINGRVSEKVAKFKIANTGTTSLPVDFLIPKSASNVRIEPISTVIYPKEVKDFVVIVSLPETFEKMHEVIPVKIGDFQTNFTVNGEQQSAFNRAAALSIFNEGTAVGTSGAKIPNWAILIVAVALVAFIFKEYKKGRRRK